MFWKVNLLTTHKTEFIILTVSRIALMVTIKLNSRSLHHQSLNEIDPALHVTGPPYMPPPVTLLGSVQTGSFLFSSVSCQLQETRSV